MKQIRNMKTGRIGLCLALTLLWVPLVQAGMEPTAELSEKKFTIGISAAIAKAISPMLGFKFLRLDTENSIVIANEYAGTNRLRNSLQDAKAVEKISGALVLTNQNKDALATAFQLFSHTDCSERKEAKLLWFSGHTYEENFAYGNGYGYGLVGNEVDEKLVSQSSFSMSGLMYAMSSSNCHFVLVMDSVPPKSKITFPANVTVIWSDLLGGTAFDINGGSLHTRAVIDAIKHKKTWKTGELTAFLRQTSERLLKESSEKVQIESGRFLNGRPAPQPWVQSFSSMTTIKFPDSNTPRPKAISDQDFPTVTVQGVPQVLPPDTKDLGL